jgi:hypothetical protein
MAIPEAQLATWAKPGAAIGSATTYASIKRALESTSAVYTNRDFDIFLQGSYGNDTNIYAESDVDVVICNHSAYYWNIEHLSADEQATFKASLTGPSSYSYDAFKGHVEKALKAAFSSSARPGKRAIKIEANGARRSSDVIVAFDHRRYSRFRSVNDCAYDEGISFFPIGGGRTDNFPQYHSDNTTSKHQATNNNFKPVVRIFKNMRGKLVDDGVLAAGDAPSYFIEGLLYNVPNVQFRGSTWAEIVLNILRWLHASTDRTEFVCVNERYFLLRDNSPVCWPIADGAKFVTTVINLWNNWR